MKSFTERPDPGSHFQSKRKRSWTSPMWNMSCMSFSRASPFRTSACTPSWRKLFRISFWTWARRGFACFTDSASIPKVRYFVLVRPLFPWESCIFSMSEYSDRTSSNPSFRNGMRMLFSKFSASVDMFMKESSKRTELSKKFKNPHHSSKIAVLSSCWASW